jgi:acyl-CoA thioester hydrolase
VSHPDHATTVELTVPFHDCDPLAVAWHGRYFEYFEASREALLRSVRLDVPDLMQLGIRMFVTEVRCRYNFRLAYADRFAVTSWFTESEPLIRVAYEIHNLTQNRKSARASTRLALTDNQGHLYTELPAVIRERLPRLAS